MDRFEDDVIFDIADIHAPQYTAFLKLPGAFEHLKSLQDRLEEEEECRGGRKRYSSHVFQTRLNPPCYRMLQDFNGIRKLCNELDLDLLNRPEKTFLSKLIAGGDYTWAADQNYARYQRYTVEVFGFAMTLPALIDGAKRLRLPDRRQYATPPKYWYESPFELVQIWRTRIFRSELFTPSLTNPFTPYRPSFPYLEERWHPNLAPVTFDYKGFDKFVGRPSMHSEFLADTYKILMRAPTASGRPRRYEPLLKFYLEARKVYRQLSAKGNRPSPKEIALRMNLSKSSFNRYWARTKIRLEDAHETFKSDLIPPQILSHRFNQ